MPCYSQNFYTVLRIPLDTVFFCAPYGVLLKNKSENQRNAAKVLTRAQIVRRNGVCPSEVILFLII